MNLTGPAAGDTLAPCVGTVRRSARSPGAAEIFATRWTPLIIRNLLLGCRTFRELQDAAPGIPRSLLTERLHQLERLEIVARRPNPSRRGWIYELTDAGQELAPVCHTLGTWGARWLEAAPHHLDAAVLLPQATRLSRRPHGHDRNAVAGQVAHGHHVAGPGHACTRDHHRGSTPPRARALRVGRRDFLRERPTGQAHGGAGLGHGGPIASRRRAHRGVT
jgi:DNA-binding HxlR family transcriptional regulator